MAVRVADIEVAITQRSYWISYVSSAQIEAGRSLGFEPNAEALAAHRANGNNLACRPTIQEWDADQVENALPWAFAIGQAISVIGSFLAFHTYGVYDRQERTLAVTRVLNQLVAPWRRRDQEEHGPVRREIREFIDYQLEIDELNASRIEKYAISALVFVAGGACTLAGVLIDAAWLVTVGKVVMVAAVIATIATYLWHRGDTASDYSRILISSQRGHPGFADKILHNLPRLHRENMGFRGVEGDDPYHSLYPQHYPPALQWNHWELPAELPAQRR